jgi:nucleoside-diphosphate-sugar epimerase
MKVLITGATGFSGTYLIDYLSTYNNLELIGLARGREHPKLKLSGISWIAADLLDLNCTVRILAECKPDLIVHLAGLNQGAFKDLLETNVVGTRNLLDAVSKSNPDCRTLVISSSAIYGYAGNTAIPEDAPQKPLSEYGISKMAQDALSQMYYDLLDLEVAVVRPFNLIGPGQPTSFVCGRIVQQMIDLERRNIDELKLLEISSRRDFIDIRDAVKGYWAVLSHPSFNRVCAGKAFNVGSGKSTAISDVIDLIGKKRGIHYPVKLPENSVSIPIPTQHSDNTHIQRVTGWRPEIPLIESLTDMVEEAQK